MDAAQTAVKQARENLKYQLYTFANSAVLNVSTRKVATWYDNAISIIRTVSLILTICCGLAFIATTVLKKKKEA